MTEYYFPAIENIHTIVFDFDGVFTNNKVLVNSEGVEFVVCDRGDGLGLDFLRKYIQMYKLNIDIYILSKEQNEAAKKRASKLKLNCFLGVDNKLEFIKERCLKNANIKNSLDLELIKRGIIFLGNDLNDYESMRFAGFSVAPINAHPIIKDISSITIDKKGGDGFVRKFVELFLKLDKGNLKNYC